ncbi:phage tail protein [Pseudomonas solani]|uniref:phage tail protein n=1 Tax=Pseudomonas solani TaxID=2731552 RepID=UPI003D6C5A2D
MADQNSQFMAILTALGEARLANAQALGIAWNITQLGVGDGNGAEPMPDRLQTALINERRKAPLNQLKVDPNNASIIIAEQVIPEDVGGWWIREIGLYDEAGDLVAVANCPPTFKPQLAQGSGRTQVVRLNLLVSSTQSITLKIDPSVVLATRAYCDGKVAEELAKLDHKQSVRVATTANIALNGLQTIDGIVLVAGDRVLVKNQATAKDNGLYVVAAGAWARAVDADLSAEVTPGLIVHVEQGTTLADTRWQLVTDGNVVLGTTALTFQNVTQGFAPLVSPAFTGNPVAPTPPQFDSDTSLATTEFVQRALGNVRAIVGLAGSYAVTGGDAGMLIAATAAGMTLTLPALSSVPSGAAFTFHCNNTAGSVTIACVGAEAIQYGSKQLASIVLKAGDAITLVSDGATSWTPVAQSAGVAKQSFAALRTASPQAISSGVSTKVQFNSEEFDPHGVYDHVSTFRFQPTIPGKYLLSGNVQVTSPSNVAAGATPALYAAVHKNGGIHRIGSMARFSGGGVVSLGSAFSVVVDANGTDYFEIYAYHDTGLANVTISATAETHFSAARIV